MAISYTSFLGDPYKWPPTGVADRLSGTLECTPSSKLFWQYCTALPFLRHFSLIITNLHRHTLQIARRIGFDGSAWGVLPTLSKLSSLSITYPRDLSPTLAGWFVP
ncbi:hypothetical protein EV363DRAFT_1162532 [Boletus edulis]|nr:hypothetical protein EV363DRAFT_1191566 [Boletus edulis]KAF8133204.1 hypothetical protein EV363DRAFT_1162532 [Boletus edulis]